MNYPPKVARTERGNARGCATEARALFTHFLTQKSTPLSRKRLKVVRITRSHGFPSCRPFPDLRMRMDATIKAGARRRGGQSRPLRLKHGRSRVKTRYQKRRVIWGGRFNVTPSYTEKASLFTRNSSVFRATRRPKHSLSISK